MRTRSLMRPRALVFFYRRRLRVHGAQELFAGAGVAVAVALMFAVMLASASIGGSAEEVTRAVIGPASLQLRARGPEGFPESFVERARAIPGVVRAAPLLEAGGSLAGPDGRSAGVTLVGTTFALASLDGLARTLPIATLTPGGVGLSEVSAREAGLAGGARRGAGASVSVSLGGSTHDLRVDSVLGREAFGALAGAQVAVMPLAQLQALAGLRGRITRVLVQSAPGRQAAVRAQLAALAGNGASVTRADQDSALLRQALRPTEQASDFFAAIAGLLGFLFAFNALLLTVPERRQVIADLRLAGTRRGAIVQMVLFQALCLGVCASLAGLLAGYLLSLGFLHESASYLAQAFTLGGGTVFSWRPLAVALIAGVGATCVASTIPLLDLRRGRALDAVYYEDSAPGNGLTQTAPRALAIAASLLLAGATAVFLALPALAPGACVAVALATVALMPAIFAGVLRAAGALAEHNRRLTTLPVAIMSLRATTLRSLALAATGALALFGSVALGGARNDLLRGIEGYIGGYVSGAEVWVLNAHDPTAVEPLPASLPGRVARLPGVAAVESFQNGYLNLGSRRLWVVARPAGSVEEVLHGQVVRGDATSASARIGRGGWIAVSQQVAGEHHVGVGGVLALPTPAGTLPFRIAATTTNLTWSPGAILMSTGDYRRAWLTRAPTALGVELTAGASVAGTGAGIARLLGGSGGAQVLTPRARAARTSAVARQGLAKLAQISTLLLVAAVMAIVAALTSAIWQRRASLAGLRVSGVRPGRLRRILLTEALLMLCAACVTGALAGIYGQAIIDRYLASVTGFPVAGVGGGWHAFEIFALVSLTVLLIVTIPGWMASRVSPALALEE
ncbi:MAG TPA: ABC transporter permease [Solirubrobacteraceae bacterium]|nr:ABC transporter permease [Solirubrobacteraceae bacterium]